MKITQLEAFLVPPRWLFLKITTDSGIYGWGNQWSRATRQQLPQQFKRPVNILSARTLCALKTSGKRSIGSRTLDEKEIIGTKLAYPPRRAAARRGG
jgi:hypothetical protein